VSIGGTAPNVGAASQFSATAALSNGTTQSVTSQATWQSSSTTVATVSNTGLVTALSAGEADITASYQNVTGKMHVATAKVAGPTYTITGAVTDNTSGGVLPNIDVQATDSAAKTVSTKTGSTGTFTLGGLAAGTVSVTAAGISYESATQVLTLTSDQRLDIGLKRVTCTFTVNPTTFSFPAAAGQGNVTVSSQAAGCTWTARSNDSFLTITSGLTGLDTGAVAFSIASNPSAVQRTGTIVVDWSVGSASVRIDQGGATGCTYTPGVEGEISRMGFTNVHPTLVTSMPTCAWTAAGNDSWLYLSCGSGSDVSPDCKVSGVGSGPVRVAANPNFNAGRRGTITVRFDGGAITLTVVQPGCIGAPLPCFP
jgi:hypothetical protein